MYGHITSAEKFALKREEKRAKKEPDAFIFPVVLVSPKRQPKKETPKAAVTRRPEPPLRTIDLRKEDEAEIRWMKAWRDLKAAEKAMGPSEGRRGDGGRGRHSGKERERRGKGSGFVSQAAAREGQPWVHRARPLSGHRREGGWYLKAGLGRQ